MIQFFSWMHDFSFDWKYKTIQVDYFVIIILVMTIEFIFFKSSSWRKVKGEIHMHLADSFDLKIYDLKYAFIDWRSFFTTDG